MGLTIFRTRFWKRDSPGGASPKYHGAIKGFKRQLIVNAIQEAKGNYTEAAHLLGVHPNYLHRLIKNLGLKDSLRTRGELGT